jgi:hypothetical protein
MKSKKRQKALAAKRQAKKTRFSKDGGRGNSRYARKAAYLHKNALWGWEVPNPKPW